jgi:hypothetical protein
MGIKLLLASLPQVDEPNSAGLNRVDRCMKATVDGHQRNQPNLSVVIARVATDPSRGKVLCSQDGEIDAVLRWLRARFASSQVNAMSVVYTYNRFDYKEKLFS